MRRKMIIRIAVDTAMTALLLALMGYRLWGEVAHEWLGAWRHGPDPANAPGWLLLGLRAYVHAPGAALEYDNGYGPSEPALLFILDYLAIMGLFVAVSYYLCKALRGRSRKVPLNRNPAPLRNPPKQKPPIFLLHISPGQKIRWWKTHQRWTWTPLLP